MERPAGCYYSSVRSFFHAEVLIKLPSQKVYNVHPRISKMYAARLQSWNKICKIALIQAVPLSNETSSDNIRGHGIGWTVNAQLVKPFDLS